MNTEAVNNVDGMAIKPARIAIANRGKDLLVRLDQQKDLLVWVQNGSEYGAGR